jgi:D-cysteine desulfhydrase/L-cysteate sulfo-lyase
LEYLLADAMAKGCDVVLTAGALQSNHARLTAAVSARLGLDCHLVLKDEVKGRSAAYAHSGNRFLDNLLGAKVEIVDVQIPTRTALADSAAKYEKAGRKPYVIPVGGSNPVGCLGYVNCAVEIAEHCRAADAFS